MKKRGPKVRQRAPGVSLLGVARAASEHISRDFEGELRELRAGLLAMGARCERGVRIAFDAFLEGSPDGSAEVEAIDEQIDRAELEIHALIVRILALRQPVAADLRLLATALRLVTDLERIGDEAVNIGERIAENDGRAKQLVRSELAFMAAAALDMLHRALDAFVEWNEDEAEQVLGCDDEVDRNCALVISTMTEHMSHHAAEMQAGLRVVRVAKYLERIADHATNVAEAVIFMVRGDDVRHRQLSRRAV
jgi:phosphate transport system protein